MSNDKFLQPADGIRVVGRSKGPRTLLPDDILEIGRERVAAGEPIEDVAQDLAIHEVSMLPAPPEGHRSFRTAADRAETKVHEAADANISKVLVAIEYAFLRARGAATNIEETVGRSSKFSEHEVRAISTPIENAFAKALKRTLVPALLRTLRDGGDAALEILPKSRVAEELTALAPKTTFKMSFDGKRKEAIAWARKHSAELVEGINKTTRAQIRTAIVKAYESGNFRDLKNDIFTAIGDKERAEMIARTETMLAANEGQRQAWQQAIDDGLLPEGMQRVWIATESACVECDALDGEQINLDEQYSGNGGDGPPLHPLCRCTEGIVNA